MRGAVVSAVALGIAWTFVGAPTPVQGGGLGVIRVNPPVGSPMGTAGAAGVKPPVSGVIVLRSGSTPSYFFSFRSSFGYGQSYGFPPGSGEAFMTLDAQPPGAEVFLDSRRLGTADEVLARALPLAPGRHALEVVAPGYRPFIAEFRASPGFPTRLRVDLFPE